MNRTLRVVLALVVLSSFSFAFGQVRGGGGGDSSQRFVEVAGVREFSGELIVRPIQIVESFVQRRSMSDQMRQNRARQRLARLLIEYVADTDELVVAVPSNYDENSFSAFLMATGDYQYAEPNWTVYPVVIPNDPFFGQQWHHFRMQSPQGWNINTGSGVTLATCDTGVHLTHEDLAPLLVPGYNSASRLSQNNGGAVNDINGHGTHVMGDAGAAGNNSRGVAGVGWNYRLMPIRVTNSAGGSASMANIVNGARWAVNNGAKSISVSYSGVSSSTVQTTGAYIKSRGGLFLWAAGNNGANLNWFDWADVIIVGASTSSDTRWSSSAFGLAIDVFAPGVNILSTVRNSNSSYGFGTGTSMAAPVANGVVAMVWSINPALSASKVEQIVFQSCDNIGSSSTFGNGRVNLFKTATLADMTVPKTVLPSSVNLNRGTYISGSISSFFSQDGNVYVVNAGITLNQSESPNDITLNGVAPYTTAVRLKFRTVSRSSSINVTEEIQFYNFTTNQWDSKNTRTLSTSDTSVTVDVTSGASNYVRSSDGAVRARLVRRAGGIVAHLPWSVSNDLGVWEITAF
ncbi:MAG: S8 family serine peptidase [Armatimonadetes bacterium]|nr:S8 family serine peptidase [Armatimonadota bacterium]